MRLSAVAMTLRSLVVMCVLVCTVSLLSACARSASQSPLETPTAVPQERSVKEVVVSYYGEKFAGRKTASGEVFNPELLTAAHRSKPFGTKVRLRNPKTGKEVVLRINDRGPFIPGRTYDISQGAAKQLGILEQGVATVEEIAP